ncbi:gamma-carboxygeranoyl-CoA hydratase [Parashewanella spongiae]|uniref:Gamma-carboxygeranoyl-CoA hydratase n=1 Tax=Parashewanella spongiae TaxID=342950 RepID=A0A3A6TJV1_9GAMM|nr:enoyl-CoA hydratase-related protein [Parashewanella spongiae]MCL1079258.1 enoyl-CoA hydratase-related protein [Parashewanella spongiae]RJY07893.1 gamma-carboxygeranoyl-CoA hydratase [Parashewanella spongiae]
MTTKTIFEDQNYQHIICEIDDRGVGSLILNRVDVHNAFDEVMIAELISALHRFANDNQCKLLIVKANGKHFSAGADLNWMRKQVKMDFDQNLADANTLAKLMNDLDKFPKPTIAHVQGAAFGGALGLICCCDMAVATPKSSFCLSEVKLGLIPAVISPYVVRAMGNRASRRYMLTAERFTAEKALQLQIIHEVGEDLQKLSQPMADALLANSPQGMNWCKSLIAHLESGEINAQTLSHTSDRIARIRVSSEGQEGLNAFFEKRQPNWQQVEGD